MTFETTPIEVDVAAFAALRQDGRAHAVVDVREPWELDICGFEDALRVPLRSLPARQAEIPSDVPVIVVCHHGQRSLLAADYLRRNGHVGASSLRGGLDLWAITVDPTMRRY